jgi:hypothetical protein
MQDGSRNRRREAWARIVEDDGHREPGLLGDRPVRERRLDG